jgi:hypothetical protein
MATKHQYVCMPIAAGAEHPRYFEFGLFAHERPNVRVKRAPTAWRQARAADDKQHCRAGLAPRCWGSA